MGRVLEPVELGAVAMNDAGVSPIGGALLMVVITVAIAAIIAAYSFGMAAPVKSKVVAATARQPDPSHIIVTFQGGKDAGMLDTLSVTINGVPQPSLGTAVGSTGIYTGTYEGRDNVVVTAHFSDDSEQVILNVFI